MSKIKTTRKFSQSDVICSRAAELFQQKGFHGASMRDLALALNIEAPSLYNHVKGKEEILFLICKTAAELLLQTARQIDEESAPQTRKLERLIRSFLAGSSKIPGEMYVLNHEWRFLQGANLLEIQRLWKEYEGLIANVIKKGIYTGEFREVHPQISAATILAAMNGFEQLSKHRHQVSRRFIAGALITQLIRGIKK